MSTVSIPAWTADGVLPPLDVTNPTSANRSPYRVAVTDFVLHFGTSVERCVILDGLFRYRAALHAVGLVAGFQWVDGSFLEQVELLAGRAPRDVDVVTFYRLPAGETQASLLAKDPNLFDHGQVKATYNVDGYLMHLGAAAERLVKGSTYWYSLWSHRRSQAWKGYVEIDLAPDDNHTARTLLTTLPGAGGTP